MTRRGVHGVRQDRAAAEDIHVQSVPAAAARDPRTLEWWPQQALWERIGRALPAAVVGAAVFALAIGDGGRHVATMVVAQSAVLFVLAIAVAFGAARGVRPGAPLALMIGVVALTAVRSMSPDSSVLELVVWVTYAAIAMLAATGLKHSRDWFVDGIVLTAGWLCLVALFWFWGSGVIAARWSSTFYWPNPFAAFLLLIAPLEFVR